MILHGIRFCLSHADMSMPVSSALIPSLVTSLLAFSVITFIIGIILGIVCIKYIMKKSHCQPTDLTPTAPVPMYEEVPLASGQNNIILEIVRNEAYGQIINIDYS